MKPFNLLVTLLVLGTGQAFAQTIEDIDNKNASLAEMESLTSMLQGKLNYQIALDKYKIGISTSELELQKSIQDNKIMALKNKYDSELTTYLYKVKNGAQISSIPFHFQSEILVLAPDLGMMQAQDSGNEDLQFIIDDQQQTIDNLFQKLSVMSADSNIRATNEVSLPTPSPLESLPPVAIEDEIKIIDIGIKSMLRFDNKDTKFILTLKYRLLNRANNSTIQTMDNISIFNKKTITLGTGSLLTINVENNEISIMQDSKIIYTKIIN